MTTPSNSNSSSPAAVSTSGGGAGSPAAQRAGEANAALSLLALQQAYRSLRNQLIALAITLLVVNLSLNIFIFKQLSWVHRQSLELNQMVSDYLQKSTPEMNRFLHGLHEFSKEHPDLKTILDKYPYRPTNAPSAAPPASSSAPPK
jgi:hypothetical protein